MPFAKRDFIAHTKTKMKAQRTELRDIVKLCDPLTVVCVVLIAVQKTFIKGRRNRGLTRTIVSKMKDLNFCS